VGTARRCPRTRRDDLGWPEAEVREETGLDVEPGRLIGIYKNMSRGIVALAFRCTVTGGHLTPNEEATEFRWASPDEIRSLASERAPPGNSPPWPRDFSSSDYEYAA
jgi:8-oxo-dGTP pyrophosphatase MutT (NUDIX family)